MNREIKFRIWDSLEKSWLNCKNPLDVVFFPALIQGQVDLYEIFNFESEPQNRYILQQFIGLKDKNNKEIYEGDIVEASLYTFKQHGHFSPYYEIIFQYGKFRLKHIKSQEISIDFSPHSFINTLKSEEVQIIGNIFENPELLNK